MKAIKVSLVLLVIFLMAHAQETSKAEADKARVLTLENAWNEAEKHNDANAVDALLAPTFAYTDSDGAFMNKEQFLASINTSGYHPEQIVNENMSAQAYDHAVIVSGAYREKGTQKGKPYTRHGRFTDTWVEQNGKWLCASSQETLIKEPAK